MGLKAKVNEKVDALLTRKIEEYVDGQLLPVCHSVARMHGCVLSYEDFLLFVRNGMVGDRG